ncbi:Helix-turn-helix domain protein [Stieleria neptunia]|uniref:Helix-turn-helix domain protein n=1 Tax=Stieleria neptunia TaxID=2527979 RepID=A0A518HNX4_9BACT|nr:helix-turn-helix domain-containing protein [Stieleria neptunia]QDV42542.1 Helix-turn-helix domain protein [Stieleria neptunia]
MLLSIKEVANRLKISVSMTYSLVARGELPSYQIGSCRRVSEDDLMQFLEERRHEPVRLPDRRTKHF